MRSHQLAHHVLTRLLGSRPLGNLGPERLVGCVEFRGARVDAKLQFFSCPAKLLFGAFAIGEIGGYRKDGAGIPLFVVEPRQQRIDPDRTAIGPDVALITDCAVPVLIKASSAASASR